MRSGASRRRRSTRAGTTRGFSRLQEILDEDLYRREAAEAPLRMQVYHETDNAFDPGSVWDLQRWFAHSPQTALDQYEHARGSYEGFGALHFVRPAVAPERLTAAPPTGKWEPCCATAAGGRSTRGCTCSCRSSGSSGRRRRETTREGAGVAAGAPVGGVAAGRRPVRRRHAHAAFRPPRAAPTYDVACTSGRGGTRPGGGPSRCTAHGGRPGSSRRRPGTKTASGSEGRWRTGRGGSGRRRTRTTARTACAGRGAASIGSGGGRPARTDCWRRGGRSRMDSNT